MNLHDSQNRQKVKAVERVKLKPEFVQFLKIVHNHIFMVINAAIISIETIFYT